MKIYTKTGDKGQTSLIGGKRVYKSDLQVEVYGQIDELNSWLGLLACTLKETHHSLYADLFRIQNTLFQIGSFYAYDFTCGKPFTLPFIEKADIKALETAIDAMQTKLPQIKAFIVPGGNPISAHAHVARAVCRRCERFVLCFGAPAAETSKEVLIRAYLNRLSDYLFVLARYCDK